MQYVRNMDCLDLDTSTIEADVMITDPPYRKEVHKRATSQSRGGGTRHRDMEFDSITDSLRMRICKMAASIPRWSVIFSDIESISLWVSGLKDAGATYVRTIPWVRWSMPQLSGDRPPQGCEAVIVAYGKKRGRKHWGGPGNLTSLNHTCLRGKDKHKAEKPLDLMLDLVNWFSDLGETVFDPFAGSGTTGMACKILERGFIGCEKDTKWSILANSRFDSWSNNVSFKDATRFNIWLDKEKKRRSEMDRIKNHTSKVRKKLDDYQKNSSGA